MALMDESLLADVVAAALKAGADAAEAVGAQRSALTRSDGWMTRGNPSLHSRQGRFELSAPVHPAIAVRGPSTQAARSPEAITARQAARSTAAAPPSGAQAVSFPRGSPCPGKARSSSGIPVDTALARRCASRSASGAASGKRSAMSWRRARSWADIRKGGGARGHALSCFQGPGRVRSGDLTLSRTKPECKTRASRTGEEREQDCDMARARWLPSP